MAKFRSRAWRLTALVLWASLLLVNLAGAQAAAPPAIEAHLQASLCLADDDGDTPSSPAPHGAAPHCPLCTVMAAGVLAPPTGTVVQVLRPTSRWAARPVEARATLHSAHIHATARPRAPPAVV